ncbi:DNA primase [Lacicoccus alkaliphilus]|uniref:DNA primase n=1 Tax=Lacicoccus alkaliphilus DSM 16010 TaxID=1123231 RepID=A0A1M7BKJ2_9BACL|nr:DNA primase [Salinicoccus alkaliphilus]SHL55558.1 DNA primase [Salinicoccus alkaliphilus DSM 16010]
MSIPQETIEYVRERTDITDLVSGYLKLEKRGRNYVGLCPFHDEKTPSFSVSPEKQICHCFGCKKGGNVFQFIMEIENISFTESVKRLGKPLGVEISANESRVDDDDMQFIKMHEYVSELFHHILMHTNEGAEALNYLLERGFPSDLLKKEKVGLAPKMSSFTKNAILEKGFTEEAAYSAGLLSRNETNFSYYDRFVNRIMIPIKNHQNYIVGFTARSLDGAEPKYLNTPETKVFQKRHLMFNLSDARKSIRSQDEIILMEGHLDVLKVKSLKIENIVGLMGTALSEENINLLNRLASNVTLMFDGDGAGRQATMDIGETLLKYGLNTFVIQLPGGMDPDEYIEKNGGEAFRYLVKNEKRHYIHFLAENLLNESMNNDLAFSQNINILTDLLAFVSDEAIKSRLIMHISEAYDIDKSQIESKLPVRTSQKRESVIQHTERLSIRQKKERYFLKALMNDKNLFDYARDRVDIEVLTSEQYYGIFKGLCNYFDTHDTFEVSSFIHQLPNDLLEVVINIDNIRIQSEVSKDEIDDYLDDLSGKRNSNKEKQILFARLREAEADNDIDLQAQIMQQLLDINSRYKS